MSGSDAFDLLDFIDNRRAGLLVFEVCATGQNARTVRTTDHDLDILRQRGVHQTLQGTIVVEKSVATRQQKTVRLGFGQIKGQFDRDSAAPRRISDRPAPPDTDPASPYESLDSKKLHEAAERALDHYLNPAATPRKPGTMFIVNPELDTETLLAHACESLASANVMAMDLVDHLEGSSRNSLLGIAQVIMLGELAVNRALEMLDQPE